MSNIIDFKAKAEEKRIKGEWNEMMEEMSQISAEEMRAEMEALKDPEVEALLDEIEGDEDIFKGSIFERTVHDKQNKLSIVE